MNLWAKTIRAGRTLFEKISLILFSLSAKQYYKDGKTGSVAWFSPIGAGTSFPDQPLPVPLWKAPRAGILMGLVGVKRAK
jgi:hypothetical protein